MSKKIISCGFKDWNALRLSEPKKCYLYINCCLTFCKVLKASVRGIWSTWRAGSCPSKVAFKKEVLLVGAAAMKERRSNRNL